MTSLCGDRPSVDSSLKAFMAELVRAPSPDSACEQDEPWSPLVAAKQGGATEASGCSGDDTQSECSDASNQATSSSSSAPGASRSSATSADDEYAGAEIRASQCRVPPPPGRTSALVNQDSDGDSGIDGSVDRFSQRVGSTSSADTEPSSCNDGPVERRQLHETSSGGNDGGSRTSYVAGPPRVHFDEGLPFSEQHMRRSCRQLMAALYASSSSTRAGQLDPRSAGRYRSFSLPVRAFEEDELCAFKRLSVPAARTLPSSFGVDGRNASSHVKLSVAPTVDADDALAPRPPASVITDWPSCRRSSLPPVTDSSKSSSSFALPPADSNDSHRLGHDVPVSAPNESTSSTSKHPAYCISATFKCSKAIPSASSLKDAACGAPVNCPARNILGSAQCTKEAAFTNGQYLHDKARQEHRSIDGTSRDSDGTNPSRCEGLTNNRCSGEAHISELRRTTTCDLRAAQPVRTAPREAVVTRVQPTRPVSSHSTTTSTLSGPKPKTTLPPKALPLSLPGMPPKSSAASRGLSAPDSGAMRVLFARPAAVVPDVQPLASHAEPPPSAVRAVRSPSARRSFLSAARPCTPPTGHCSRRDDAALARVVANGVRGSLLLAKNNKSSDDLGRSGGPQSPCCAPREAPSCFAGASQALTADASPKSTSLPTLVHQGVTLNGKGPAKVVKGGVEYAVVTRKPSYHHAVLSPIPRITSSPCVMDDTEPPLPPRKCMHKSDFALYYGPASSSSSLNGSSSGTVTQNDSSSHGGSTTRLFDRVQGIGRSARSALLRAFSTERIYRPQKTETAAVARDRRREILDGAANLAANPALPSPSASSTASLVMGLKARMSLRKSKRRSRHEATGIQINAAPDSSCSDPLWAGGHPTHVSAQLLQQNLDGTQVVELRRPPGRSFGFFLARGRVHAHHGVFVSRMPDAHTQQVLQGLLDIGDEILEVNGTDVRDADIMTVNSLMTNQSTLLLTVLPYICRKDI
ncbi:uncharacterized protein [Dermacentor andersoni]|uniref:uncharacterized protein n=1 Tax=Dermacentor andersoni TaxID=34620 RepID=UPI003B3B207F